jgi:uncharacterized membrane protein
VIIQTLLVLLVVAVLLWLIATYAPRPFGTIAAIIVLLLATFWTLRRLGMMGALP